MARRRTNPRPRGRAAEVSSRRSAELAQKRQRSAPGILQGSSGLYSSVYTSCPRPFGGMGPVPVFAGLSWGRGKKSLHCIMGWCSKRSAYICMHVYTYACMYVCMYVCMHVCMHVCMYVCVYMCVYIYVSVYIYMHIYIYVNTHVSLCL